MFRHPLVFSSVWIALRLLVPVASGQGTSAQPPVGSALVKKAAPAVALVQTLGRQAGSGFLIEHKGSLMVVTNSHVLQPEGARLSLTFFTTHDDGSMNQLVIPPDNVRLVARHRTADLALLRIDDFATKIRAFGVKPLDVASQFFIPDVGSHIYVIGHPGAADGAILTHSLTEGIVSGVRRDIDGCQSVQYNAAVNPGNSGGPLLDETGRVVGVVTCRLDRDRHNAPLQGLGFALEVSYVHSLLDDPRVALPPEIIGNDDMRLQDDASDTVRGLDIELLMRAATLAAIFEAGGLMPYGGDFRSSTKVSRLAPDELMTFALNCASGVEYAIGAPASEDADVDMLILDDTGKRVGMDIAPDSTPIVRFTSHREGEYDVVLNNSSKRTGATVIILIYKKPGDEKDEKGPSEH